MDYEFAIFVMAFIALIILAIFGGQLLIYWLIDKYTVLNFPLIYRMGLAILVTITFGYCWLR